jgi:hypothetical protein
MAILKQEPDRGFVLKLAGYEFPHLASHDDLDSNWLHVDIAVADRPRRWTATAPVLLTGEVTGLIAWIRALADAQPDAGDDFGTVEPNLQFEASGRGDETCLKVFFSHEFHPEWAAWIQDRREHGRLYDLSDAVLALTPGIAGLRDFADQLEHELTQCPERSPRVKKTESRGDEPAP